jgi:hypothetical protein
MNDAQKPATELIHEEWEKNGRPGPPGHDPLWDTKREGRLMEKRARDGTLLTMREWCTLFEFKDYQILKQEDVGPYWVSTVWLGMSATPGMFFETMVFSKETSWSPPFEFDGIEIPGYEYHEDHDERRYPTEETAFAGHEEIVTQIKLIMDATGEIDPRVEGDKDGI